MIIYAFSGLGADERLFDGLVIRGHEIRVLPWLPVVRNQSLQDYAKRYLDQIDTSKPFGIMGISLGGMICTELAQQCTPTWIGLISSTHSPSYLPLIVRLFLKSRIYFLLPNKLLQRTNFLTNYFFSVNKNHHAPTLNAIFKASDPRFIKWALKALSSWKGVKDEHRFHRFHGKTDRLIRPHQHSFLVNGGHFVCLSKHKELGRWLREELCDFE